jgi:hypothetical protein
VLVPDRGASASALDWMSGSYSGGNGPAFPSPRSGRP